MINKSNHYQNIEMIDQSAFLVFDREFHLSGPRNSFDVPMLKTQFEKRL